ncbi:hypothetical protein M885DRAFT_552026 [Pelagophyceae sp. CCMP2097]|nr:hypothetical protein M885DRAFT_552026 [Pelagophyceae sp. CCMP2097]
MARVYVGGLEPGVAEAELRQLFKSCGTVAALDVQRSDVMQGMSRGFAFVTFASEDGASKCIKSFDKAVWRGGRKLRVAAAQPRYLARLASEWNAAAAELVDEAAKLMASTQLPAGHNPRQPSKLASRVTSKKLAPTRKRPAAADWGDIPPLDREKILAHRAAAAATPPARRRAGSSGDDLDGVGDFFARPGRPPVADAAEPPPPRPGKRKAAASRAADDVAQTLSDERQKMLQLMGTLIGAEPAPPSPEDEEEGDAADDDEMDEEDEDKVAGGDDIAQLRAELKSLKARPPSAAHDDQAAANNADDADVEDDADDDADEADDDEADADAEADDDDNDGDDDDSAPAPLPTRVEDDLAQAVAGELAKMFALLGTMLKTAPPSNAPSSPLDAEEETEDDEAEEEPDDDEAKGKAEGVEEEEEEEEDAGGGDVARLRAELDSLKARATGPAPQEEDNDEADEGADDDDDDGAVVAQARVDDDVSQTVATERAKMFALLGSVLFGAPSPAAALAPLPVAEDDEKDAEAEDAEVDEDAADEDADEEGSSDVALLRAKLDALKARATAPILQDKSADEAAGAGEDDNDRMAESDDDTPPAAVRDDVSRAVSQERERILALLSTMRPGGPSSNDATGAPNDDDDEAEGEDEAEADGADDEVEADAQGASLDVGAPAATADETRQWSALRDIFKAQPIKTFQGAAGAIALPFAAAGGSVQHTFLFMPPDDDDVAAAPAPGPSANLFAAPALREEKAQEPVVGLWDSVAETATLGRKFLLDVDQARVLAAWQDSVKNLTMLYKRRHRKHLAKQRRSVEAQD